MDESFQVFTSFKNIKNCCIFTIFSSSCIPGKLKVHSDKCFNERLFSNKICSNLRYFQYSLIQNEMQK